MTQTIPAATATRSLEFEDKAHLSALYGAHNGNLERLEKALGILIVDRGNRLVLDGPPDSVATAESILLSLWKKACARQDVGPADIDAALRFAAAPKERKPMLHDTDNNPADTNAPALRTKKKTISARSPVQADYLRAIRAHEMVFGLGPAGTGKTYLAVAAGVEMFLDGHVERLIFCRPAVEAGERLGFLPGDMKEKVDPYLRPIYDALHDMLPMDFVQRKMTDGDIEIAPLAFMRGRTLSNAFVILDEGQNATPAQMKMFLTRMGEGSRLVVTGDPSQTDLPPHTESGLSDALRTLKDIPEIAFVRFSEKDVVRHALVGKIVRAYDSAGKS